MTIYTVANAILFRDLPFASPGRVVTLERRLDGELTRAHSPADMLDLQRQESIFESVSASAGFRALLSSETEPRYARGTSVTPEYFTTLGVQTVIGNTFERFEGQTDIVVISWGLWQSHFGGDTSVVGTAVSINGDEYRVVGVMPSTLAFLESDLWVLGPEGLPRAPFPVGLGLAVRRDIAYVTIYGRLNSSLSLENARAAVRRLGQTIAKSYPPEYGHIDFDIVPLKDVVVGDSRRHILILLAAVLLTLVLACSSVAAMLLGRGLSRADENAVRLALGASRWHVLASGYADGLVLAALGGIGGTVGASMGVKALLALAPPMHRAEQVTLDSAALTFAIGVTVLSALLAGTPPALQMLRRHSASIAIGRTSGVRSRRQFLWTSLLVFEVAATVVLLSGSLSLSRSLLQLASVDLGFDPSDVLVATIRLPRSDFRDPATASAFFSQLTERIEAYPEINSVGMGSALPLSGDRVGRVFSILGATSVEEPVAWLSSVGPGYFATIGMRLIEGRDFSPLDRTGAENVAIINQSMAKRYWPSGGALGSLLQFGDASRVTVVGVVSDVRHGPSEAVMEPRLYRSYWQEPNLTMSVVVRGSGDMERRVDIVKRAVNEVDRSVPSPAFGDMHEALDQLLRPSRYLALVVTAFAFLSVMIMSAGLYGLLSLRTKEETPTIAIRLALGASRRGLVATHVAQGLGIAAGGIIVGLAVALLAQPLVESAMETPVSIWFVFSWVVVATLVVSGLASIFPARLILRLDPRLSTHLRG